MFIPIHGIFPVHLKHAVVDETDIDSHDLAAFSTQDKEFLEKRAALSNGIKPCLQEQNTNGSGFGSLG